MPLDRGSGIDKGQRTISLSFGVAVLPDNGQSVEGLLRAANEALYQAKMDGKIAWWWLKAVRRRRLTAHNSRFDRERRLAFNLRQADPDAKETAMAVMAIGCCSRSNWLFDRH